MTNQLPVTSSSTIDAKFPSKSKGGDVDLRELLGAIWSGKIIIAIVTILFSIASVIISINLPNIYKAEALLAPASNEQSGGLSALAGQFGGLAAMAGINLGSNGSVDKTVLAIEVLKSKNFLSKFIRENNIIVPLMAAKDWDIRSGELIFDEDIYDTSKKEWVRKPNPPRGIIPSEQEAVEEFSKILSISKDKNTSLIRVSVENYSPMLAQRWVSLLIKSINEEIRQRDLKEAKKSIHYLQDQLSSTNVTEIKSVLYQLIEEQSKTMMFAKVRDEYAFKVIDPAVVPELKFKPKRALICVAGFIFGGVISMLFVVVRYFALGSSDKVKG